MFILDLNQICHASIAQERAASPNMPMEEGLVKHFIFNSIRANIVKFRRDYGKCIICSDSTSWRYSYFPQYKANRKAARKEDPAWDVVFKVMNQVVDILTDQSPFPVVKVQGAEADDCIAWIVNKFGVRRDKSSDDEFAGFGQADKRPEPILIVSGDKDFQQLQIYENVQQYSPTLKKFIKCKDPIGFKIEHIAKGDVGDGIPNVLSPDNALVDKVRQSPITAKFLEEFKTHFDNITKFDRKLKISNDQFLRNFSRNATLIDLVDEIPEDVQKSIEQKFEEVTTNPGGTLEDLRQAFIANRMKNLLDVIGDFKQHK